MIAPHRLKLPLGLALLLILPTLPVSAAPSITLAAGDVSTASINAALNGGPNSTVQMPAGTFALEGTLKPPSGTHLLGAGAGRTILTFASTEPGPMVQLNNCENVELADFALDGNGNVNAQNGIAAAGGRALNLHNLGIRNLVKGAAFGPHGILFAGSAPGREHGVTDSTISDCVLSDIGVGAQFGGGIRLSDGSMRNRILRNALSHTGRGGIFADNGSSGTIVRGNTVSGSGGEGLGIEMWGDCGQAVIEDNKVDHWISLDNSSSSAVRRNTISSHAQDSKFAGLELVGSSNCVFTDNTVDDGQQIGISVSSDKPKNYIYWGYNTIRSCSEWATQFQGDAGGIAYHYFYKCIFQGTPVGRPNLPYPGEEGQGFRVNGNARWLTFENCDFKNNGRAGLQLGGSGLGGFSFVRSTIKGNGTAVTGPLAYDALEWVNCTVEGNGSNHLPPEKPFQGPAPSADFEAPAKGQPGETLAFAISSSRAAKVKISRCLWDFNDGVPVSGDRVTHAFAQPGTYRVTMLAWDENGRGGRAEKSIVIER